MNEETSKTIKRVGNYSMMIVEPDACIACHDALWGTVIIDNVCLECSLKEITNKLTFTTHILKENAKACTPECKCMKCLAIYALSVIGEVDESKIVI